MNTETKHALLDLKEEINTERDQEITVAKQDYLDEVSNARDKMKEIIVRVKKTYKEIYAERKAKLIGGDDN